MVYRIQRILCVYKGEISNSWHHTSTASIQLHTSAKKRKDSDHHEILQLPVCCLGCTFRHIGTICSIFHIAAGNATAAAAATNKFSGSFLVLLASDIHHHDTVSPTFLEGNLKFETFNVFFAWDLESSLILILCSCLLKISIYTKGTAASSSF
ncbi:hypothetical protein CEXT_487291 [Caerostris extrusa]|uniref:Uncharacterized protein n=1 Tax=Caerostris extrusa TaxID=172846 RepID=A0AAV4T6M8_CAEEX|nr:hypothetical protein CEXT_487291 [Caerostris extrusa]